MSVLDKTDPIEVDIRYIDRISKSLKQFITPLTGKGYMDRTKIIVPESMNDEVDYKLRIDTGENTEVEITVMQNKYVISGYVTIDSKHEFSTTTLDFDIIAAANLSDMRQYKQEWVNRMLDMYLDPRLK